MPHPLLNSLAQIARHCWRDAIWKKTAKGPRHVKEALTLAHLEGHLTGEGPAIGLAPIVPGTDTTRIAVLDLDSHKGETPWEEMCAVAAGIVRTLHDEGHAPRIFRSSGGAGIHIYVFWQEPVPARQARALFNRHLRLHGFASGNKGVANKEVEVFPKQDAVPSDGCGNMFILPYAGESIKMAYTDLLPEVEALV